MMALRAEIVTWAEVQPGDRVLDDGEILTIKSVATRGRGRLDVRYTEPLGSDVVKDEDEWTIFLSAHLVARLLP
jgi:hypothetical protein